MHGSNAVVEHQEPDAPAVVAPTRSPLIDMLSEAIRAGQPIEVIRELKAMAKEFEADEKRAAFDAAIADAKAEITPIIRTRDGHNSKYADFAELMRPGTPPFQLQSGRGGQRYDPIRTKAVGARPRSPTGDRDDMSENTKIGILFWTSSLVLLSGVLLGNFGLPTAVIILGVLGIVASVGWFLQHLRETS